MSEILFNRIKNQNLEGGAQLIKEINETHNFNYINENGWTILHYAVMSLSQGTLKSAELNTYTKKLILIIDKISDFGST